MCGKAGVIPRHTEPYLSLRSHAAASVLLAKFVLTLSNDFAEAGRDTTPPLPDRTPPPERDNLPPLALGAPASETATLGDRAWLACG